MGLSQPIARASARRAGAVVADKCSDAVKAISIKLAPLAGDAFLDEFARVAAAAAGGEYFLIGRLSAYSNMMRSIRLIEEGAFAPNITYSLDGTPCARAVDGGEACVYNGDVAERFPLDRQLREMCISGYIGAPLHNEDDRAIGVIVALSRGKFVNPEATVAIFEHFSRRVAHEVETLGALERYRLATDDGDIGIWDWDFLTGDMFVSECVSRMLGYGEDARISDLSLVDRAIHKDDLAQKNAALAEHLNGRAPFDIVVRMRNKQGAYRWCRLRASAQRNAKGVAVRMVGSIRDVHELIEQRSRSGA